MATPVPTYTMLRVERLDLETQAEALRAGRFLVHGIAQVARHENLTRLRPYELAVAHRTGEIFAGRRGATVPHGHLLHMIGLSGLTLRPLSTLHRPETEEDAARLLRPTRMRVVAQDPTMACLCLCTGTDRTPDEAWQALSREAPITFTREQLVQTLVMALAVLTRQRTDAAPDPVPLSAIFATLARAEPILAPSAARRPTTDHAWTGTCTRPACGEAVLEPAQQGTAERSRPHWICPSCQASYGVLDADERARFTALCA